MYKDGTDSFVRTLGLWLPKVLLQALDRALQEDVEAVEVVGSLLRGVHFLLQSLQDRVVLLGLP